MNWETYARVEEIIKQLKVELQQKEDIKSEALIILLENHLEDWNDQLYTIMRGK